MNRNLLYLIVGIAAWIAFYKSGVDPIVTGLVVGLMTCARPPVREDLEQATTVFRAFREQPTAEFAREAREVVRTAISPLGSQGSELHDRAARWIEARAGEVGPWLEGRDDEAVEDLVRTFGNPIDTLAKQVALERESISRAELRRVLPVDFQGLRAVDHLVDVSQGPLRDDPVD